MTTQSLSIILFLFSITIISHAHYSPTHSLLKNLNGSYKGQFAKGLSGLKNYMASIGYIVENNTTSTQKNEYFDETLELAIKKYQEFYNLKITGILDQQTIDSLSRPRCGMPDLHSNANSSSLYTLVGTKWQPGKRQLTYSFPKNYRKDARNPVMKALIRWMNVSPFRFTYSDNFGNADVKISFERRDHGDGSPFDGPQGVLAHAFWPTDGRLHFDADESWTTPQAQGSFDLQSVALHELGHILGLGHSPDPKASMYAYFNVGEKRDLNNDDVRGIHALYPK